MVEAVIFDMDGLMVDTQKVWDKMIYVTAEQMGLRLKPEFADAVRGSSGESLVSICEKFIGPDIDIRDFLDKVWENADIAFEQGVDKKPGLDELLEWLKAHNVPMAVASGSKPYQIEHHITILDLTEYFDALVSGFDVPLAKPYPDIFLAAAKELGVEPSRSIVLEDSSNGILAAYAGGFIPIMVPDRAQPTDELRAKCAAVCESLADVIPLLESGQIS